MLENLTTNGIFVMLSLLEIVVIAIAFSAYSYMNHRIVKAHKGDSLYKKETTLNLFSYMFILLAALFISIAFNFFVNAYWLVCLILTGLTIISVYTAWQFYRQMGVFQERRIPEKYMQKYRDDAVNKVKKDFEKELKKVSPQVAKKVHEARKKVS